jgi:hypothetical protein
MQPPDQRHRTVGQFRHDVDVPQRPGPVQAPGHQPGDDLLEVSAADGPVHRDGRDVPRDVELRVIRPGRPR